MKTVVLKVAVVALALAALYPGQAMAQPYGMRFTIPFAFSTGERTFDPGGYTLRWSAVPYSLQLGLPDGKTIFLPQGFPGKTANAQPRGKLIFHQYGSRYFLRGIERPGAVARYEWPASKAERETLKGLDPVVVAVLSR